MAWHPDQPLLLVAREGEVRQWTPDGVRPVDGLPPAAAYRCLAFSPDGQTLWARPAVMRVLSRALILDCDGYATPVFSLDGRHFAIRGNAYDNSLEVFEFPSLTRALATTLGEPSPGYPYPAAWLEQRRAWSRHNIAFAAEPGVLWVGTPTGALVEIDLDAKHAVAHDVLAGSPVTALCTNADGDVIIATGMGELVLMSVQADSAKRSPGRLAHRANSSPRSWILRSKSLVTGTCRISSS